MLVIIVVFLVALELIVIIIGTAVPDSRLQAMPTLVDELRKSVSEKQSIIICNTALYLCTGGWHE